jgi:hypothetical protein
MPVLQTPAVFWIVNARNYIVNNHAVAARRYLHIIMQSSRIQIFALTSFSGSVADTVFGTEQRSVQLARVQILQL